MSEGNVLISAVGSTTGITTLEYEPGLVGHDVNEMFELFAPYKKAYKHNQTWQDDNSVYRRPAHIGHMAASGIHGFRHETEEQECGGSVDGGDALQLIQLLEEKSWRRLLS